MVVLQGIFALIGRSLGKILNTVFSWATIMLFGKVPAERQIYLSIVAFGSVVWLIVLLGVIFPSIGSILIAFAPLPRWVDRNLVRLAMLAAVIILPAIIGVVALLMLAPEDRPRGALASARAVLRGYPVTLALAVTLVWLTIVAPIQKVQTLARRWTGQHMAVIVEPEDYFGVVEDLKRALKQAGWDVHRRPASWMMRWPTRVVTILAGGMVKNLVAEKLATLSSDNLEVTLHPSDLVIAGSEEDVVHARATVAEQLAFSKAHMTWTKTGNEIEDRIDAVWRDLRAGSKVGSGRESAERLRQIERDLKTAKTPFDEWEVLFREKLLVERGLLQVMAGITEKPREPSEARSEEFGLLRAGSSASKMRLVAMPVVAGILGLVTLALLNVRSRS